MGNSISEEIPVRWPDRKGNAMPRDKMQRQRFERKYRVSEELAEAARDFVSSYLEVDEYGVGKPNYSYPVHSLYLDSDLLATYWMTVNSDKNRFKLRLRFYDAHAESPVFFEIKRRVDNCIFKQRGGVPKGLVPEVLAGQLPPADQLLPGTPNALGALEHFIQLMEQVQARPKVHVAYMREAWVDPRSNTVRVTFDREVRGEPEPAARFRTEMTHPVWPFRPEVILELKFTDRFPNWLRELVEGFNLINCGAAKYCEAVEQIGLENLGAALHRRPDAVEGAPPPTPEPNAGPTFDEIDNRPLPRPGWAPPIKPSQTEV